MCVNNITSNTKYVAPVAMSALVLLTIGMIALVILMPPAAPVAAVAAPAMTATIFGLTGGAAVAVMMTGFFMGITTLLFICAMAAQSCQRLQYASKHGGES